MLKKKIRNSLFPLFLSFICCMGLTVSVYAETNPVNVTVNTEQVENELRSIKSLLEPIPETVVQQKVLNDYLVEIDYFNNDNLVQSNQNMNLIEIRDLQKGAISQNQIQNDEVIEQLHGIYQATVSGNRMLKVVANQAELDITNREMLEGLSINIKDLNDNITTINSYLGYLFAFMIIVIVVAVVVFIYNLFHKILIKPSMF
ncbi:MAG: hypothetical protein GX638_18035 [Crenarchaeota archaeon]|nr:hypothetical protein [Thermoproteota archaeon]